MLAAVTAAVLLAAVAWAVLGGGLLRAAQPGQPALRGPEAEDFTVPTLDGGTFTLSEQEGKVTVVYIMAYWCGTCIPEARALARLYQEFGPQRLSVLALDVDPTSEPELLRQFRARVGDAPYSWGFDEGGKVVQLYKVRALDSTYIINQRGELVYSDQFSTPYEMLREQLERLL